MVGFPHSEIPGSKLIRSSPRLIAAYYVLHRLHTPRHPLDALKTLDRSHYQCPQLQQPNRALVFAVRSPSSGRSFFRRITASVLIGQIKKNQFSRTALFLPEGVGSNRQHCVSSRCPKIRSWSLRSVYTTKLALFSCDVSIVSVITRANQEDLVEPDGIEPTTSCLQSRRSPS